MNIRHMFKFVGYNLLITLALLINIKLSYAQTIVSGAGSSFQKVVQDIASYLYNNNQSEDKIIYQSIGSGAGIEQLKNKSIDFAASDAPLNEEELTKYNFYQFPNIAGAIVPIYNISEVKGNQLQLDGKTLASIYMGKITYWDDQQIQEINKNIKLPHSKIRTVHRADSSGTTKSFSSYLNYVSAEWKNTLGVSKSISWPTGIGGQGNSGVAVAVASNDNSIGYIGYSYAVNAKNKFNIVKMKTSSSKYELPNTQNLNNAINNLNLIKSQHGWSIDLKEKPFIKNISELDSNTWPIAALSFIIIPKDNKLVKNSIKYLDFLLQDGSNLKNKISDMAKMIAISPELNKDIIEFWKTNKLQ